MRCWWWWKKERFINQISVEYSAVIVNSRDHVGGVLHLLRCHVFCLLWCDVKGKFISFGCDDNLFSYSPAAAAVAVCGTLVGTPSRGDNFGIPILPLKYNCWQSHFS